MPGNSELWNIIEGIVREEGLELFDIEVPPGRSGVLRVFIDLPKGAAVAVDGADSQRGVQHQHCVAVSRRLLDLADIERLVPGDVLIEVSSPGINRRLTRPEHFRGALGERVKLKLQTPIGGQKVFRARLLGFDGQFVQAEDVESHAQLQFQLGQVESARIDFDFG